MTRLERVARAICVSKGRDPDFSIYGLNEWENFKDEAQAAIDAMGDGWQPIESAPDDTCVMIAFHKFGDPTKGRLIAFAQSSDGNDWYEEDSGQMLWSPTHWMPLPEPPK
jgi:hypothetical protein